LWMSSGIGLTSKSMSNMQSRSRCHWQSNSTARAQCMSDGPWRRLASRAPAAEAHDTHGLCAEDFRSVELVLVFFAASADSRIRRQQALSGQVYHTPPPIRVVRCILRLLVDVGVLVRRDDDL
jgi:hypothetical protein